MYIHAFIIYTLKIIFKFLIFGFVFFYSYLNASAQNFELTIHSKNSYNTKIIEEIKYTKNHPNKESALLEVDAFSKKLSQIGYLDHKYTIIENKTSILITFELLQKVELIRIYFQKKYLDISFISQLALKTENNYFEIPLSQVEEVLNKTVTHFEQKGYSFTNIFLNNLQQKENILTAELNIDISNKRTIDKVIFKGYPDFPKKYIQHYLEIKSGESFNLESVNTINDLVNTIPFVTQIKKPEVLFTKDSTIIYVYVKKKQTSNFDGIIGFSNDESSGNLKFNGYLDLNLNNILNKGENFLVNWESNQQKNSSLELAFNTPYVFNSKLNLEGRFNIFKQDSSYINTKGILKLGYNINQNNAINILGVTEKSDLSSINNNTVDISNFKKNALGISYIFKILEDPIYYNRYRLKVDAGYFIGNRKDELEEEQQNSFEFLISYILHFNKKNSIFIKTTTKILNTTNTYENELYRIGGINSIRGFNENSILTSKYNVTNLEYQYNVNYKSYLYTITDFALINNTSTLTTTQLYGLGMGYYLNTDKIILNISYALGKNYKTPFNFNNSKVHIKLTYPF